MPAARKLHPVKAFDRKQDGVVRGIRRSSANLELTTAMEFLKHPLAKEILADKTHTDRLRRLVGNREPYWPVWYEKYPELDKKLAGFSRKEKDLMAAMISAEFFLDEKLDARVMVQRFNPKDALSALEKVGRDAEHELTKRERAALEEFKKDEDVNDPLYRKMCKLWDMRHKVLKPRGRAIEKEHEAIHKALAKEGRTIFDEHLLPLLREKFGKVSVGEKDELVVNGLVVGNLEPGRAWVESKELALMAGIKPYVSEGRDVIKRETVIEVLPSHFVSYTALLRFLRKRGA